MKAYRQLHTVAEIKAAVAAGEEVEYTANNTCDDRIDMPTCTKRESGGWITFPPPMAQMLSERIDSVLATGPDMFRARNKQ